MQIQRFVGKGRKWEIRVRYSVEKKLLGMGGALKNAERLISGETVLAVNGDTFADLNLIRSRKAFATLAAVKVADKSLYGRFACIEGTESRRS